MNIFDVAIDVSFKYYLVDKELCFTKTRKREVVQCRQIAMYLIRKYTNHSLTVTAFHIGDKDHATVVHAVKTINDLMESDHKIKKQICEIEKIFVDLMNDSDYHPRFIEINLKLIKYRDRIEHLRRKSIINKMFDQDQIVYKYRNYKHSPNNYNEVDEELSPLLALQKNN